MRGKFLLAVTAATLAAFLAGWLIMGVLFADYYGSHTAAPEVRSLAKDPPLIWAIFLGNLGWAFLITYFIQLRNAVGFGRGFLSSLWISFLLIFSFDISMYAFWDMYTLEFIAIDIAVGTLFWGLVGGVAGAVLGMKRDF